jgi:hypothetical protein
MSSNVTRVLEDFILTNILRFDGADSQKKRLSHLISSVSVMIGSPTDPTPIKVVWQQQVRSLSSMIGSPTLSS